MLRRMIVGLSLLTVFSSPAWARVDLHFGVEVAPPIPQVEVVPEPRAG
jgi:hypothetical protein